jgi:hypothetical protein
MTADDDEMLAGIRSLAALHVVGKRRCLRLSFPAHAIAGGRRSNRIEALDTVQALQVADDDDDREAGGGRAADRALQHERLPIVEERRHTRRGIDPRLQKAHLLAARVRNPCDAPGDGIDLVQETDIQAGRIVSRQQECVVSRAAIRNDPGGEIGSMRPPPEAWTR